VAESAAYQHIIKYIEACINDDIGIDIGGIAAEAGYSAHHVYKIFKIYSPYPVMEYVRRARMYAAANELYMGRKILDIALDYGYETPAGFYKAFVKVFGCAPSMYRKNAADDIKGGTDMRIEHVTNIETLDACLALAAELYPQHAEFQAGDGKYSRAFWVEEWGKHPELLLYADDNSRVDGVMLGWVDGGGVTIAADGVIEEHKGAGLYEALLVEIEKRAKSMGYAHIGCGIGEGDEDFFSRMGYIGKTLIQSEKHSVDDLKAFNARHGDYEVTYAGVYEGYVNQIWLNVPLLDRNLKRRFEEEIGDCWVQVIVSKDL